MKRVLIRLFLVTALFSTIEYSAAAETQNGLWQLFDSKDRRLVCSLVVTAQDLRIYSVNWREAFRVQRENESKIQFKIPYPNHSSVHTEVVGSWGGASWNGSWKIVSLQFQTEGEWKSRRVSTDPDWSPWAFMGGKETGYLDLLEVAKTGGNLADFSTFENEWQENVDAKYLPISQRVFYGGPGGVLSDSRRTEALKGWYTFVTSNRKAAEAATRELGKAWQEVTSLLKSRFDWYRPNVLTVCVPLPGGKDFEFYGDMEKGVVILNPLAYADHPGSREPLKYLTAQALIYAHARMTAPFPLNPQSELGLRGMAARISCDLNLTSSCFDSIFMDRKTAERLSAGYPEIYAKIANAAPTGLAASVNGLQGDEYRFVAFQFGQALRREMTPKQMVEMDVLNSFIPKLANFLKVPSEVLPLD